MWRPCLLTAATFVCVCAPAFAHPHHTHPHTHEAVEAPDTVPVQYPAPSENARWLAGDHHVHSEYSVTWSEKGAPSEDRPPVPRIGGDAIYPIIENALQARACTPHPCPVPPVPPSQLPPTRPPPPCGCPRTRTAPCHHRPQAAGAPECRGALSWLSRRAAC